MVVILLTELFTSRYYDRDLPGTQYFGIAGRASVRDHDTCLRNTLCHLFSGQEFLYLRILCPVICIAGLDEHFFIVFRSPVIHIFDQPPERLLMCTYSYEYHDQ